MAGVAWYLLLADHVVGSSGPVLAVSRLVSVNDLVLVNVRNELVAIESIRVIHLSWNDDGMNATVGQDISLDLACGISEALILGGHVPSITWKVLLVVIAWSCESCHFCEVKLILFYLLELKLEL